MLKRVILRAVDGYIRGKDIVIANGSTATLGRSKSCSFPLSDPCCLVSRHHCLIQVGEPSVRIRDLESLNGTYVNGEMIGQRCTNLLDEEDSRAKRVDYPLWEGDKVRLGDFVFEVVFDPPAPCAGAEPCASDKLWQDACPACC
jgi:pSer/pThr/pTyr-binding forkhead associated (FHA) protein